MTRKKLVIGLSAAALVSAAAIGGAAVSANSGTPEQVERSEIAAVNGTRVSLAQAVAIAERQMQAVVRGRDHIHCMAGFGEAAPHRLGGHVVVFQKKQFHERALATGAPP